MLRSLSIVSALTLAGLSQPAQAQFFPTFFRAPAVQTVLVLSNDTADNEVIVGASIFGQLYEVGRYSTGGTGNGGGLGSQGALIQQGNRVLAVSAGSDELTLFRRRGLFGTFLQRRTVVPSGGTNPTSVTARGSLIYVLNAGSDTVTGFRRVGNQLTQLASYPLSGAGVAAAQVAFTPSGDQLVVTERATNQIVVFPVLANGSLGAATVNPSAHPTPFGFGFRRDGLLIVSEADGGQADASAVSSYRIQPDGTITPVTAAAATTETAACWIESTRNGRFTYTTNTASGTVTGYRVAQDGSLTILDADGVTGGLAPGARPIDFEFGRRSRVLFVLDSGNDELVAFFRGPQGSLIPLNGSLTLPDGAAGLVAR